MTDNNNDNNIHQESTQQELIIQQEVYEDAVSFLQVSRGISRSTLIRALYLQLLWAISSLPTFAKRYQYRILSGVLLLLEQNGHIDHAFRETVFSDLISMFTIQEENKCKSLPVVGSGVQSQSSYNWYAQPTTPPPPPPPPPTTTTTVVNLPSVDAGTENHHHHHDGVERSPNPLLNSTTTESNQNQSAMERRPAPVVMPDAAAAGAAAAELQSTTQRLPSILGLASTAATKKRNHDELLVVAQEPIIEIEQSPKQQQQQVGICWSPVLVDALKGFIGWRRLMTPSSSSTGVCLDEWTDIGLSLHEAVTLHLIKNRFLLCPAHEAFKVHYGRKASSASSSSSASAYTVLYCACCDTRQLAKEYIQIKVESNSDDGTFDLYWNGSGHCQNTQKLETVGFVGSGWHEKESPTPPPLSFSGNLSIVIREMLFRKFHHYHTNTKDSTTAPTSVSRTVSSIIQQLNLVQYNDLYLEKVRDRMFNVAKYIRQTTTTDSSSKKNSNNQKSKSRSTKLASELDLVVV